MKYVFFLATIFLSGCANRVPLFTNPQDVRIIIEREYGRGYQDQPIDFTNLEFPPKFPPRQSTLKNDVNFRYVPGSQSDSWWLAYDFTDKNIVVFDVMVAGQSFNYSLGEVRIICTPNGVYISGSKGWIRSEISVFLEHMIK